MSKPRNHHYVSRVLSNKFMSPAGRIHKYNKHHKYNKYRTKSTTKSLFSKTDLNVIKDKDGNLDHESVEAELNNNFETNFDKHYRIITEAVEADREIGKVIDNSELVLESIRYLIGMALIGEARHPERIENINNAVFGLLFEIAQEATDELKEEIYSSYRDVAEITNKNPTNFTKLRDSLEESMGEIIYSIQIAPEDEYFLLPDCTAAQRRFALPPDIIDGQKFYHLAEPIGMVLMPINSKILLIATSARLIPDELKTNGHGIYPIRKSLVHDFNKILFNEAYAEVACEDKKYLSDFVKSVVDE